jgi:hypothetical protein
MRKFLRNVKEALGLTIHYCLGIRGVSFIAGLSSLLIGTCYAQTEKIIPSSPEAAALTKMLNYPVSNNTGVPDITIPFYNVECGGMTMPISMSYHAGGFKITEQASSIGLGWSLSTDIQITREINGIDDFHPMGYIGNNNVNYYSGNSSVPFPNSTLETDAIKFRLATGGEDGEPDKFYYKLLNKAGCFYFLKNQNQPGYSIITAPYTNIQVQFNNHQFIITDVDGTKYYFGTPGVIGAGGEQQSAADGFELSSMDGSGGILTGWKCKRIVNARNTHEINFSYTLRRKTKPSQRDSYVELYNNESPGNLSVMEGYNYTQPQWINLWNTYIDFEALMSGEGIPFFCLSSPKYFSQTEKGYIRFNMPYMNGSQSTGYTTEVATKKSNRATVVFSGSNREAALTNIVCSNGMNVQFTGIDTLQSIRVWESSTEIKKVDFFQSYGQSQSLPLGQLQFYNGPEFYGTRYLDSIQISVNNSVGDKYAFVYRNKFCFGNHLQGSDAWGYVNEATNSAYYADSSILSMPKVDHSQLFYSNIQGTNIGSFEGPIKFSFGGAGYWNEYPDEVLAQSGILQRIIYPTGGYTDFEYESNKYRKNVYFDVNQVSPNANLWEVEYLLKAGGLRIKTIKNYERGLESPVERKVFWYGDDGAGQLTHSGDIGVEQPYPTTVRTGVEFEGRAYILKPFKYTQDVYYLKQQTGSCAGQKACLYPIAKEKMTTYRPRSFLSLNYASGASVYYNNVTEYTETKDQKNGKIEYTYIDPVTPYPGYGYNINGFGSPYTSRYFEGTNKRLLETNWVLGTLLKTAKYKYVAADSAYKLIERREMMYTPNVRKELQVLAAFLNNVYQLDAYKSPVLNDDKFGNMIKLSLSHPYIGTTAEIYNDKLAPKSFSTTIPDFNFIGYKIPIGEMRLDEERIERYEEQGGYMSSPLVETVSYSYLPNYTQPFRIVTTRSDGDIIAKDLKYPYDFPGTAVYDSMKNANIISTVVQQVLTNQTAGLEINRSKVNFGWINAAFGFYAPTSVLQSNGGSGLDTIVRYDKYDDYGNILQLKARNEPVKSYLWGYRKNFPVVEFVNRTYESVSPVVDFNKLNSLNYSDVAAEVTRIRPILNDANTFMSSFLYKPFVGLSSKTTADNRTTYYTYDALNRLAEVKDDDQNIIKKFDYVLFGISQNLLDNSYFNYGYNIDRDRIRDTLHPFAKGVASLNLSSYLNNSSISFDVTVILKDKNHVYPDIKRTISVSRSNYENGLLSSETLVPAGSYEIYFVNTGGYAELPPGGSGGNNDKFVCTGHLKVGGSTTPLTLYSGSNITLTDVSRLFLEFGIY